MAIVRSVALASRHFVIDNYWKHHAAHINFLYIGLRPSSLYVLRLRRRLRIRHPTVVHLRYTADRVSNPNNGVHISR